MLGRSLQVQQAVAALAGGARCTSVVGHWGAGKTAVALKVPNSTAAARSGTRVAFLTLRVPPAAGVRLYGGAAHVFRLLLVAPGCR